MAAEGAERRSILRQIEDVERDRQRSLRNKISYENHLTRAETRFRRARNDSERYDASEAIRNAKEQVRAAEILIREANAKLARLRGRL